MEILLPGDFAFFSGTEALVDGSVNMTVTCAFVLRFFFNIFYLSKI